ncbi:MAG: hypothetical protein LBD94_00125 [Rickettsiales bacterium]|jgi:hypothetical protein|nr:hypothetical protein [Rickettsiales bacterium]
MNKKDHELVDFMMRLANKGARRAQKEARKMGLPNVYFIGGRPVYEMPDGELRLKYKYIPAKKS